VCLLSLPKNFIHQFISSSYVDIITRGCFGLGPHPKKKKTLKKKKNKNSPKSVFQLANKKVQTFCE
jgi:hypothetical protein